MAFGFLTLLAFMLIVRATIASEINALETRDGGNYTITKSLHILPLGASITYGLHSSTGNGYREDLRELLSPTNVTFVGSVCSGNMTNPNSEGHPGYQTPQMEGVAKQDMPLNPNVVLIYVGTNDMIATAPVSEASSDMSALVSFLRSNLPDALIVVSNLFDSADPRVQQRIDEYNKRLYKIQFPANTIVANISEKLSSDDFYKDGIHPNDSGYLKMAQFFHQVLLKADANGDIPERQDYQSGEIQCPKSSSAPSAALTAAGTSAPTATQSSSSSSTSKASASSKVRGNINFWHYVSLLAFFTTWYIR